MVVCVCSERGAIGAMAHIKLIDDPETCVDDLLAGLQAAFPQLDVLPEARAVVHTDLGLPANTKTVGLISGGGAGHEPFCAGFVGTGMLSAAVTGSVFASPPTVHVESALKRVAQHHKGGVLLVIPNYTGDCLNFGLAFERAKRDGTPVEKVIVGEDCALLGTGKGSSAGRRGMCGLVFVYKIVGQLASEGAPLEQVAEIAQKVVDNMATMGLAIRPCSLPGSAQPLLTLDPGTVEVGIGVHGEAGVRTIKMTSVSNLNWEILEPIRTALELKSEAKVAVLVNNLGGLTQLEQWVAAGIVRKQIESWGVQVIRLYCAPIMTSLETAGIQVCILKISDEWLRCLDAPTSAPGWPGSSLSVPPECKNVSRDAETRDKSIANKDPGPVLNSSWAEVLKKALQIAATDLISNTEKMNELDSGCGDGDCGSTLARLAKALIFKLPTLSIKNPAQLLLELADLASTTMGGTSGAVYGLLFSAASDELRKMKDGRGSLNLLAHVANSWHEGLQGIMRYSKARQGDRTMLDALIPACEEFKKLIEEGVDGLIALQAAVAAAKKGRDGTANMSAKVGRASYVNEAHLSNVDAGAHGVVVWLEAILKAFYSK